MIKIRIRGHEFTLNGQVWSGDNQNIVDIFNSLTASRPFHYEPSVEHAVANYIVELNQHRGAEIIFDDAEDESDEDEMQGGYY